MKRHDKIVKNAIGYNRDSYKETITTNCQGHDTLTLSEKIDVIDWSDTLSKKLYFGLKCTKDQANQIATDSKISVEKIRNGFYGFTVNRNKSLKRIKSVIESVGLSVDNATLL